MNVMDLSDTLNKLDSPFLLENSAENCTETLFGADNTESTENFITYDCDIASFTTKYKRQLNLLDKAVSIDEQVLQPPLQPILVHDDLNAENNGKFSTGNPPSILRRESYFNCKSASDDSSIELRRVSFPTDESVLAIYREPEADCPWIINTYLPAEKILQIYQSSCKQHNTIELDIIKNVISNIKNNTNHSALLNLSMLNITNEVNETLEDLLKVANFRTLILYECKFTSETISEFLNMLEYYESVCEIQIAMNFDDIEAWKSFCNACSNIVILESISFKCVLIDENYMRMLLNAVKNNTNIVTLKFDGCILDKLPSFYLVENLITNTTLCELYLPSSGLYTKEADCLGHYLQKNSHLKVLDISNNFIGDRGLEVLANGLTRQDPLNGGLSVLIIFNNQITEKSGPSLGNIIMECKNLHTLNVGFNHLTDEIINDIRNSLQVTTSLEGLGLQCTLLTCKGIDYLSAAIEENFSLQKINLKGNKAIQVAGLERLCQALTNSKISKIEVDETNRSCHDPQAYVQLVKKISAICTVNKSFKDSTTNNSDIVSISQLVSRKVSLSCEPNFLIPDIAQSSFFQTTTTTNNNTCSTTKSRFKITSVQDSRPSSRFKVTKVASAVVPDEVVERSGKFANVRSSVSSNDSSVDSLQLEDIESDE